MFRYVSKQNKLLCFILRRCYIKYLSKHRNRKRIMAALTSVCIALLIKLSIDILVLFCIKQFTNTSVEKLLTTAESKINAKHAQLKDAYWSGNSTATQFSFPSPPGPDLYKAMCGTDLCFWFVTKHLYLTKTTYSPDTSLNFKSTNFTCNTNILKPLIDSYLPSTSPQQPFDFNSKSNGTLWGRQFFWKFTGTYKHLQGNSYPFTYDYPITLASGHGSTIFGFCTQTEIHDGTCSKNAILVIQ